MKDGTDGVNHALTGIVILGSIALAGLGLLMVAQAGGAQSWLFNAYLLVATGIVVLYAVPLIGSWYTAIAGSGPANLILRAAVAGVCLIPPTLLMGATLPAIARWVETTPRGVSWLGFFYGGNLAGAVVGGVLLGLIEALGSGYIGVLTGGILGSHYSEIFAFIVLIVILTLRPSGLLGERVADRA